MAAHDNAVQLAFNIPLGHGGDQGLAGVSSSFDDGVASGTARYDNPADPDGGFGYRLAAGWQDGTRLRGRADWIGDHIALDGGVSLDRGIAALQAKVQGALVLLRGSLFAAHDPGGAVALVEAGEKNIRIYRENRPVAVSDADGEALLTGLNAFAPNHIAVEPRDYGFDALVEKTDAVVVPRQASGVVVDLKPLSRHPLLATVTRGIAMATPMGARVMLDGWAVPLTLGRDGQLFIADLETPRGADIDLGTTRCRIYIRPAKMGDADPLLCLREAHGAY
jgi:outer membrane usher protein